MLYPVLKLTGIYKRFSDFFALRDISMELFKGEVHVLIGENGSGKSSLVKIIWGVHGMDSGEICVDGTSVSINSPADAKGLGIAVIHQDSSLFEHYTVAENIYIDNKPYLNKTLKIIDWKRLYSTCQELLGRLGLTLDCRSYVKDLNIAQKQLVEICKAYISNARIIIMDEPTSSLTESESLLLFNIVNELKKSGAAILYISHKLEEIKLLGDRITVIRDGEIIGTSPVGDMDSDSIIRMMAGVDLKERYPKLDVKPGREILRVANLYSGSTLKDISFRLRRREILGIIGLVGSGRTKIAKCIFGIDRIESGEVYIDNKKVSLSSPADAIKNGIGYVTEDRYSEGLFMHLGVPENITAPSISRVSNNFLIDRDIETEIANTYVEKLGIKIGDIYSKAAHLSGGSQQKVVLAKWIMTRSRILILDEPTKGIDTASKVDVYNLMNEMVTKDVSIILISSDANEVIGMCDRIMVLFNGRIAAIIPKEEATREKIMFYATGGKSNPENR